MPELAASGCPSTAFTPAAKPGFDGVLKGEVRLLPGQLARQPRHLQPVACIVRKSVPLSAGADDLSALSAMDDLNLNDRRILELRYFRGLSYREIADVRCTTQTAQGYGTRALKRFKAALNVRMQCPLGR